MCPESVFSATAGTSASSVSAASATMPHSIGVRRPMWRATVSIWIADVPSGNQSRYGKSVPTMPSKSQSSNELDAAGLPISPFWPTLKGLSQS